MAILINEQKLVEENAFKFENRLNTQVARFLDKSPVFVTYFHINNNESTVDGGFKDVEDFISKDSPIKFQRIDNFPLYGIDPILLNLDDTEQGLDSSYQGEAMILPNTIHPLQHDFFEIKHLHDSFLFEVIGIEYDNIRPDNYYKINFKLGYLDDEKTEQIETQIADKYTCILQNIGTENNCLIQDDYYEQLQKIDVLFNDMVSTYKAIFYNQRYNCFLGETTDGMKLYDPLQTEFFNRHSILNKKNDLSTIILNEGFADNKRAIKYEKSMYRFFERRDASLSRRFGYRRMSAMSKTDSQFSRWHDESVVIVDIITDENAPVDYDILPSMIATSFKLNGPTDSKYIELMQKFVRKEDITIFDIPLDLNEVLLTLDANEEVFFFTPILLYIIQTIVSDFLSTKNISS